MNLSSFLKNLRTESEAAEQKVDQLDTAFNEVRQRLRLDLTEMVNDPTSPINEKDYTNILRMAHKAGGKVTHLISVIPPGTEGMAIAYLRGIIDVLEKELQRISLETHENGENCLCPAHRIERALRKTVDSEPPKEAE